MDNFSNLTQLSNLTMVKIALPDVVAGVSVYLASKASSYVTGQNIIVDGGYSVW